ncbi:MAG: monovalent cation/H(+) antiporter subunit G [Deltaproteobacteria bacterium]|nr:MAG: monovalent cation/H(+) antiporter subunit G [Deltaproteobacteria bacterium]
MVAALLFAAVGIALAGAAGVWLMRNPYQRLHYLALPSGFSGLLVTIAVLLHDPQKQAALKVALTALALFAMNAVLTHATARAAWVREHGEWPPKEPPGPP